MVLNVKQVILHHPIACVNATGLLEKSLDSLSIMQQLEGHHNCIVRFYNFDVIFTCDTSLFFLLAALEGGSLPVIRLITVRLLGTLSGS